MFAAVPRREQSPDPWRECEACGWRNSAVANEDPVRASVAVVTSWVPAERCGNCGEPPGVDVTKGP
jgi:hypothetical protein